MRTLEQAALPFGRDVLLVRAHVRREQDDYATGSGSNQEIVNAVIGPDYIENLDALDKVVGWVLWVTSYNRKYRRLTLEERAVRAAALRLSCAFDHAWTTLGRPERWTNER